MIRTWLVIKSSRDLQAEFGRPAGANELATAHHDPWPGTLARHLAIVTGSGWCMIKSERASEHWSLSAPCHLICVYIKCMHRKRVQVCQIANCHVHVIKL
jgi:aspartyl/asparaginyl beta-hydroxylase (cupin superfamily)